MMKILFVSVFFLASCAQFQPFVDARREAGQIQTIGQSTADRVAVCYNPIWSDETDAKKLAVDACAQNKRKAQFDGKTYFDCTLVLPLTAFYQCVNR